MLDTHSLPYDCLLRTTEASHTGLHLANVSGLNLKVTSGNAPAALPAPDSTPKCFGKQPDPADKYGALHSHLEGSDRELV